MLKSKREVGLAGYLPLPKHVPLKLDVKFLLVQGLLVVLRVQPLSIEAYRRGQDPGLGFQPDLLLSFAAGWHKQP